MCLFRMRRGKENWRTQKRGRRKKRDVGEGEWRKVGDEGVKVVGVVLLLEPVALTLTVAWKPNQSVSIHTESGFMWADSSTGLYDRALVSHGHHFFFTLLPALCVCHDYHLLNSIVYCACMRRPTVYLHIDISVYRLIRFYMQIYLLPKHICNCTWASVLVCTCDELFVHVKVDGHHM